MKRQMLLTALSAILLATGAATAQQRYGERPPVVVSPDLSAPWVMQLRRAPVGAPPAQARQRRAPQGMRVQLAPEPPRRQLRRAAPEPAYQRHDVQQTAAMRAPERRSVQPSMDPKFLPQTVAYNGGEKPGTIVIDTRENFLYLVQSGGQAKRYGVGTGKPGFEWAGAHKVTAKREWPDWRPPAQMIAREKAKGRHLPVHMAGGPENPLGARALYLGSTLYRIHGTNQPWTIGQAVSSGCIRMRNEDVIDLYERVPIGARVVVM